MTSERMALIVLAALLLLLFVGGGMVTRDSHADDKQACTDQARGRNLDPYTDDYIRLCLQEKRYGR